MKPDAWIARGVALLRDGELVRAADAFLAAAELAPDDWRLPNEAGICFYRLERYDDAVRCYERALVIAPTNVDVLLNKGVAHAFANRDGAALQCFRAIFALDADDSRARLAVARLMQETDKVLAQDLMCTTFNTIGGRPNNLRLVTEVGDESWITRLANELATEKPHLAARVLDVLQQELL
jgi:Flp pilus assembly protein TadD